MSGFALDGVRRTLLIAVICGAVGAADRCLAAVQSIRPSADGTLVDGGGYGPFDGVADQYDWSFNESGYEGAITLNRESAQVPIEHRVVWEFNLSTVTAPLPVKATLTFRIRGASRFPAADAEVDIYAYPADLLERATDFDVNTLALVGRRRIAPFQPSTEYTLDVGRLVNDPLRQGTRAVAFRFQVNPDTVEESSQAFMDVVDSDPTTKPVLTIDPTVPGDADQDQDLDVEDYGAFVPCLKGPDVTASSACRLFDFDRDGHVDLNDYRTFEYYASFFPR